MAAKIHEFNPKPDKPGKCPYCGSHDTGWTFQFSNLLGPMTYFAFCYTCHVKGPARATTQGAIDGWNCWSGKAFG